MTATTKDQARQFANLLAELEPEIRRAFMASVTDLQAHVDWPALLQALEASDIQSAIEALHIEPAAFQQYASVMTEAYAKAGASTAAQVANVGIRFNMSNPRAQEWIQENVGNRITGFTQEQVKAARVVIETGYNAGQGPRNIATDLVGRVVDGERKGGVVGLDAPRAARYQRVAIGMRTKEGVESLVTKHRDGTVTVNYKVNKATADRIIKAYNAGTEVPKAAREISEKQYMNALLKARADTIARTETAQAVMGARMEEWRQLVALKGIDASAVIKTWHHNAGATEYHRPDHLAMNGTSVRGLYTPFVFPDGTAMQMSHDSEAPAEHVVNCRCAVSFRLARGVK